MTTKPLASRGSKAAPEGWTRGHLPSSGVLLGVLVETYGLRCQSEYLGESTARRWFKGHVVRAGSRERIIGEIARSAQASFGESTMLGSEELLASAAAAWDGFRGTASSMSNLLESPGGPWSIPVLIVRGFVMASVSGCLSVVVDDDRSSRREDGVGPLLRLWQRADSVRISRDELARLLRRSRNAVDAWLDQGALPKPDNIRELARVFGHHLGRCERQLATELRRRIARVRLGRRMLEVVRRRPRVVDPDAVAAGRRRTRDGAPGDRPWTD